jgi:hypothetical protein
MKKKKRNKKYTTMKKCKYISTKNIKQNKKKNTMVMNRKKTNRNENTNK